MIISQLQKRFRPGQEPPEGWGEVGWLRSDAGELISPEAAMSISAVYACVRILAESVASLPLMLYRRRSDGGKERVTDHPLYELLHNAPNREMSSFTWRETCQGHVSLWGNTYSQVVYDGGGRVREIWPLRPDRMTVGRTPAGELGYEYRRDTGEARVFRADEILHIPGMGFDGLVGYSPITLARNALGLSRATEKFGSKLFANGARPSLVIKTPGTAKLSDAAKKRLQDSWNAEFGGVERAHSTAVLEEGMDIASIGVPPEDAQFLETRRFQLLEIARMFRVPPHMLAELERATFSNIEHQAIEFVVHTLRPWLVRWEQSMRRRLLTEAERAQGYFVEFAVDGLLRGDAKSRNESYRIGRNGGWLSVNDIRSLENLNPIDNGDIYLQPLNMVPAGEAEEPVESGQRSVQWLTATEGETLEARYGAVLNRSNRQDLSQARDLVDGVLQRAEPADEDERSSGVRALFAKLFEEHYQRILRREMQDVPRLMEKGKSGELKRFYDEYRGWMVDQVRQTALAMAGALSRNGQLSGEAIVRVEGVCEESARSYTAQMQSVLASTDQVEFPAEAMLRQARAMAEQIVTQIVEVMDDDN